MSKPNQIDEAQFAIRRIQGLGGLDYRASSIAIGMVKGQILLIRPTQCQMRTCWMLKVQHGIYQFLQPLLPDALQLREKGVKRISIDQFRMEQLAKSNDGRSPMLDLVQYGEGYDFLAPLDFLELGLGKLSFEHTLETVETTMRALMSRYALRCMPAKQYACRIQADGLSLPQLATQKAMFRTNPKSNSPFLEWIGMGTMGWRNFQLHGLPVKLVPTVAIKLDSTKAVLDQQLGLDFLLDWEDSPIGIRGRISRNVYAIHNSEKPEEIIQLSEDSPREI